MSSLKIILVVDDNLINRTTMLKILSKEYTVMEADSGKAALKILTEHGAQIAAVMLALAMEEMDGFAVLEAIKKKDCYDSLPIVVTADCGNNDDERKALSFGAWDFIAKPYDGQIIMFRLKNAINRNHFDVLKQLKYLTEYDSLTGIYNKTKFFNATREMLDTNRNESFVFLRFDVDRFQLINSFFGTAEGDKLLVYIANQMIIDAKKCEKATYGRIESDVVALCLPYDKNKVENMVRQSKKTLAQFNLNYDIVPSVGIYVIKDVTISVEEMYNRATLAAKTCKGNYVDFYAYYNESMSVALTTEQEITNEMNYALENGQFEIYMQPQYNIHTNLPCGAEALVRWMHPTKGIISPDQFIPIFERNGFITKLDYYVWEQACKCLRGRIDHEIQPNPISVNVSRVNVYNPNLVEMLLGLVEKYGLEPALLNLELTESAYTDNPTTMKKVMAQLQSYGFIVMMDDFGSGYSSLALLKDIAIDILKIDMRFLEVTEFPGRGRNIIASVIRMAKWLNIPVIAEGAETEEQVDFLRSVGCDYVQGYYFARPMPISEYQQLCIKLSFDIQNLTAKKQDNYRYDDLFSFDPKMKRLFNNALQAAVIYEFMDDHIEPIRVNEAYYALLGHDDMLANAPNVIDMVEPEYREPFLQTFRTCTATHKVVECEYMRSRTIGNPVWINMKLRYASMVGNKHILIGELTDITMRKELDSELERYKASWLERRNDVSTILIVDDVEINRTVLKKILQGKFLFFEAENGKEAIEVLRENRIDLILLDISMPIMDGKDFLKYKQNLSELRNIPVIMATADDSPEQQANTFSWGANDYIVKPFIPAVVMRRVNNVLEANHRFKEMVLEYNTMSEQVKIDRMTGLLNRVSVEEMISKRLGSADSACIMMMFDIDNFKKINDTYGHDYGDKVICAVAEKLRLNFRKEDVIARMGGDEFAVFMDNTKSLEIAERKAYELCGSVKSIKIDGRDAEISCSAGIALSSDTENTFETLYHHSDKALYSAKCRGRDIVSVYGEESAATSVGKWITDAESVLDIINDSIYACDKETYELIYANANFCKFAGATLDWCKGKKCYEVLMHKTAPCEFCPLPKISEDKIHTRLFHVPNTSQILLMRGRLVKRNGKLVHLEVAVDVTEVENMNSYWEGGAFHE